jgi:hypothetical protein
MYFAKTLNQQHLSCKYVNEVIARLAAGSPAIGRQWKKLPSKLADPWAISSWLASTCNR